MRKNRSRKKFRVTAGAYRYFVHLLGEHPGMNQHDLPRFFAAQNLWDQNHGEDDSGIPEEKRDH
jgi:hypothetical protein